MSDARIDALLEANEPDDPFAPAPGIEDLILSEEPVPIEKDRTFNPKFNAREEFVIWVHAQYPNKTPEDNQRIMSDKDIIYEAICKACQHGQDTTRTCVREQFSRFQDRLNTARRWENGQFAGELYKFIDFLENLSENLNNRNPHYGTRYPNGHPIPGRKTWVRE